MGYIRHNKEEHQEFRDLCQQIKNAKGKKKKDLFEDLYVSLYAHHESEEAEVFPILKERAEGDDREVVLEMAEEHSLAMFQFAVIHQTSLDNETWDAKFSVLEEVLTHHMDEEEEELSKVAKAHLSKEEDEEILEKFEATYDLKEKEKKKDLK